MMKKLIATAAFATGLMGLATTASQAECGTVTIANMNWQSAEVLANIDKLILSKGYGCDAQLVTGDTMPTFTAMNEKGEPDIAPELWINAVREPLKQATDEGRLIVTTDADDHKSPAQICHVALSGPWR